MCIRDSAVFAQLFRSPGERDGNAISNCPGVRVVAVEAAEHTACCPSDHPNSGTIHCRSRCEGMKEPHVAAGQCGPKVCFRKLLAQVDAQFERTFRVERCLFERWLSLQCHGLTPRGKFG